MTISATTDPFTDDTLPRWRSRCALCSKQGIYRVQVSLAIMGKGSRPTQGKHRTRSVRFCEEHGLEQWARQLEVLP